MNRATGNGGSAPASNELLQKLKKPQYALPAAIVAGMLAVAFGVQPGGTSGHAQDVSTALIRSSETATTTQSSATPSPVAASPTVVATVPASATGAAAKPSGTALTGATSEVAGARSTPGASPTVDPALQRQPTQCGTIKETTTAVAVEQAISGVSIKATRVAVYPIDYFRCILMATGGQEAYGLASSVMKAEEQGQTTIVLVDLWIANGSKQFAQVNVKGSSLAAAGQSFGPLATLGGRSEVVVSSGQGRAMSLVFAMKNTVGATTGPMTIVVEGPLTGGNQLPGKYQLFLPTP